MLRMGVMGTGLHFNLDKFQQDFTRVQNFDVLTNLEFIPKVVF